MRDPITVRPLPSPARETALGLTWEPVVVRAVDEIADAVTAIADFDRASEAIERYEDFARFATDALADCESEETLR